MIKVISLRQLRNAEFIQFQRDVMQIIQLNGPGTLLVQEQFDKLTVLLYEIEDLFALDQGNPITASLVALDLRRDNAISGISALLEGWAKHYEESKAQAARLLLHNLSLYGTGIARQNYLAETTTINNIVNDWRGLPNLYAAVNSLGLEDWLSELARLNSLFNEQYILRTQELGSANPDTIRNKRNEVTEMYYFMRSFIDFYHESNKGAQPWHKTMNEWNVLIDQYNVLLAGRQSNGQEPNTQG